MSRRRSFDYDEARRLRATGLTYAQIGERLGVCRAAVGMAIGAHGVGQGHGPRLRTSWNDLTAYCGGCDSWKVHGEFPRATDSDADWARPVRSLCRECDTAKRKAWRAANREHENAWQRERKRARRERAAAA